jgi:hypothetical protein
MKKIAPGQSGRNSRRQDLATQLRTPGRVYGHHDLRWHGNVLLFGRQKLAQIEPDTAWPGMWRVRVRDVLTDMVNLPRARDAARALALGTLNWHQETRLGAPPVAQNDRAPADGWIDWPAAMDGGRNQ